MNKVNSKTMLTWDLQGSPSLSEAAKQRFLQMFGTRVDKNGKVQVVSDKYRDQARNEADCLEKLKELILAIASPPKARKPSKPTRGAVERRLDSKRRLKEKKQARRQWD